MKKFSASSHQYSAVVITIIIFLTAFVVSLVSIPLGNIWKENSQQKSQIESFIANSKQQSLEVARQKRQNEEIKKLIDRSGNTDLSILNALMRDFAPTYNEIDRLLNLMTTYICEKTEAVEVCKTLINTALINNKNQRLPQAIQQIGDMGNIHQMMIKALWGIHNLAWSEQYAVGIRENKEQPENNATWIVYEKLKQEIQAYINNLNVLFDEVRKGIEKTKNEPSEENTLILIEALRNYSTNLYQTTEKVKSYIQTLNGGAMLVVNFTRNEYLNSAMRVAKDLKDALILSTNPLVTNQPKDVSTVTNLLDYLPQTPTYKEIGSARTVVLPHGETFYIAPKIKMSLPTNYGLIQLIEITNPELNQAKQLWKEVIVKQPENRKNILEQARLAQAKVEVWLTQIRQQERKIAQELCELYDTTKQCVTNMYLVLEAIFNGESKEEIWAIFCGNKGKECKKLPLIIKNAANEANSIEEFISILQKQLNAKESLEKIKTKIEDLQTLVTPLKEYIRALMNSEEPPTFSDLITLLRMLGDVLDETEKGQNLITKISNMLCGNNETETDIQECIGILLQLIQIVVDPNTTPDDLSAYIKELLEKGDQNIVVALQETGEEIIKLVKLSLVTDLLVKDMLDNRGEYEGVQKMTRNYNTLLPLYERMTTAYQVITTTNNPIELSLAIADFMSGLAESITILSNYYIKDMESGASVVMSEGELLFMKRSEIFAYDVHPPLAILYQQHNIDTSTLNATMNQVFDKSRTQISYNDVLMPIVLYVKTLWVTLFGKDFNQDSTIFQSIYTNAKNTQKDLNVLIHEITQLKVAFFEELNEIIKNYTGQ